MGQALALEAQPGRAGLAIGEVWIKNAVVNKARPSGRQEILAKKKSFRVGSET